MVALELAANRLGELARAGDVGVARFSLVDRGLARLAHVLRRIEVGLALGEGDDGTARACELVPQARHLARCRRLHARDALGEEAHCAASSLSLKTHCAMASGMKIASISITEYALARASRPESTCWKISIGIVLMPP